MHSPPLWHRYSGDPQPEDPGKNASRRSPSRHRHPVRGVPRPRSTSPLTTVPLFLHPVFARYAERMVIENELDADISGFHLNALAFGAPLEHRPRHHAHRARRQLLPAPRPHPAALRAGHTRPDLATLPGQHRNGQRRRRPRARGPRLADLHPGVDRRRLPRTRHRGAVVGGRRLCFGFPPR